MITGWLVKIVIVIAVLGLAVVEIGSPLITRASVDGAAHDAADDAAAELFQHHDVDSAKAIAAQDAAKKGATLEDFKVDDSTGRVTVKVFKQAKSIVVKKLKQTRSWYQIRVTASSAGPGK